MRKLILLLPLLGCQPEYGELQPQYEQLQEVKRQSNNVLIVQRQHRSDIDSLQRELDEFTEQISQLEAQTESASKAVLDEIERTQASFKTIEGQIQVERNELRKIRRAIEQKEARVHTARN